MKLRPLHDRVIVKRLEEERKTAGGIVIPDTAAEKPSMGEVIAAGPGKTDDNGKLVPVGNVLIGLPAGARYPIPAGGLSSTGGDLARLYQMMLNRYHN